MSLSTRTPSDPSDGLASAEKAELTAMLRAMLLIRAFESHLMRLPKPGFQLLSAGEEAVAVGVCAALGSEDTLLSSGRSIGPALCAAEPGAVMAELLGKTAGPCRGKGGRGHLAQPAAGFFGAHAVVGGNLSVAAGVALAAQMQHRRQVVACIFGDGACGAGSLHETLNVAALWKLPLLFVCCNNQYSVSTPVCQALAPVRLSDLAAPFGISGQTVDGMDAACVRDAARIMAARARAGEGPGFLECVAYRFNTHSTATRESRPEEEIRRWNERCPIRVLSERMIAAGQLDASAMAELEREAEQRAAAAISFAEAAPFPDPSEGLTDVE